MPPVEHQENEKDTMPMAIRVRVNICCSYVQSPTPSHTQPLRTLQINCEVYFFKEVFARYYILRHYESALICIWLYNTTIINSLLSYIQISFSCVLVRWLVGFYGISTFVGYLTPNPFLYTWSILFQTIQFSINTQFNCQKHFYFKLFSLFKQFLFR